MSMAKMGELLYREGPLDPIRDKGPGACSSFSWSGDIRFTRLGRTPPGVAGDASRKRAYSDQNLPALKSIFSDLILPNMVILMGVPEKIVRLSD
jgi:hypothetical protein